jgi:cytochrome c-type biogenesis protein
MQYLITFLEGILSFLSPCMLPLLPVYISYFGADRGSRQYTFLRTMSFIAGFTLIFTLLGVFAGAAGTVLVRHQKAVDIICGGIMVFFGLCTLGVIRLGTGTGIGRRQEDAGAGKLRSFLSAFVFGVIYAVNLTPCVGAFLGSALMLAASGTGAGKGALLLVVYSLGLGIPFALSSLILDSLRGMFDRIKRHYNIVNTAAGLFLIVIGILVMTGWLGKWMSLLGG